MAKVLHIIFAAAVFCVSCSPSPVKRALAELDADISMRDQYELCFARQCDTLREELGRAAGDSLRWEAARRLYRTYIHFSADSAAHYIALMRASARTPAHLVLTDLEKIRLLIWANEENDAQEALHALDIAAIERAGAKAEYYATAIDVFRNLARYPTFLDDPRNYDDSLDFYRSALIQIPNLGYEGEKIRAQYLRDRGKFEEALTILRQCLPLYGVDLHNATSIHYNMAAIYGRMGDKPRRICELARSAICDLRACNRDMLSLYNLSTELLHEGDVLRASRYIKIHFEAVQAGGFPAKVIQSSAALNDILAQAMRIERTKLYIMLVGFVLLALLLSVIMVMWRVAYRRGKVIARVNAELKEVNRALSEADKIKEGYIFRYMDLSVKYLDKIGEQRSDLRRIAKNEGADALLKELRAPAELYADYKDFYRIFDTTFLGIFPTFIEQVNDLLLPEIRFDVAESRKALPTELRILAALKLGMEDSPMIASFLKCSLSTVYTYRAKLRNRALCPKDEFEDRIKLIK